MHIVVCAKQVLDPETPTSVLVVDADGRSLISRSAQPPVLNGFDENAVEAALRVKDSVDATITILSVGSDFAMDVMKKPLSMGADELVLLEDEAFDGLDSYATAYVLSEGIKRIGDYDLVICGRQASDWDNAQVGLGVAEMLNLPSATLAQHVEVVDEGVIVHRTLSDGYEAVEASMPALVTVTNELGEPRYPTLRGIMAAGRKQPTVWTAADLGIDPSALAPRVEVVELSIPESDMECELIEGEDDADAGRNLALRLREEKLI